MRQQPTPAEQKLWQSLRAKQMHGQKWRRQVPIGPYVADFFCPALRLIVEVDGANHVDSLADDARTAWLSARGYRILRFWNNEILGNLSGVLERSAAYPEGTDSPPPLERGGRGEGSSTHQTNTLCPAHPSPKERRTPRSSRA